MDVHGSLMIQTVVTKYVTLMIKLLKESLWLHYIINIFLPHLGYEIIACHMPVCIINPINVMLLIFK